MMQLYPKMTVMTDICLYFSKTADNSLLVFLIGKIRRHWQAIAAVLERQQMTHVCWSLQIGLAQTLTGNCCCFVRQLMTDVCLSFQYCKTTDIDRQLLLFSKESQWQTFAGLDKLELVRYWQAIADTWERQPMMDVCWSFHLKDQLIFTDIYCCFLKTANDRCLLVLTNLTLQDIVMQ